MFEALEELESSIDGFKLSEAEVSIFQYGDSAVVELRHPVIKGKIFARLRREFNVWWLYSYVIVKGDESLD